MSTKPQLTLRFCPPATVSISERLKGRPGLPGLWLLRIVFTVAPILFGLDKFANVLVDWEHLPGARDQRPHPRQRRTTPCTSWAWSRSSPGSWSPHAPLRWLPGRRLARRGSSSTCCLIAGYYDVALRDFGLLLGALALARLASDLRPLARRAVGWRRAGPVAGHGLRLRKLRLSAVSRATRPSTVLARPGSTARAAVRERRLTSRPQLLRRVLAPRLSAKASAQPWSASALANHRVRWRFPRTTTGRRWTARSRSLGAFPHLPPGEGCRRGPMWRSRIKPRKGASRMLRSLKAKRCRYQARTEGVAWPRLGEARRSPA